MKQGILALLLLLIRCPSETVEQGWVGLLCGSEDHIRDSMSH